MTDIKRTSLAFHPITGGILHFFLALSALVFFIYLLPEMEVQRADRSIHVYGPDFSFIPVMLVFAVSTLVSFAIILWRAWLLYIGPWWRG